MQETTICTSAFGCLLGPISSDLCSNIIGGIVGGVVTAVLVALVAWLWRKRRETHIRRFTKTMQEIIVHRNEGEHVVGNLPAWVTRAGDLERIATAQGFRVSPATGTLIEWLGTLEDFPVAPNVSEEQKHWVDKLTTIVSRMQAAIQRHDR